ncbi:MAG: hypothetical protein K2Q12_02360 [Rickettsiales bacterium]|nr:hypothetical protein [Rickettsiales bacterium]
MGIFTAKPNTIEDHVKIINENSSEKTTLVDKGCIAASGVASSALVGGIWFGASLAQDFAKKHSHLLGSTVLHQETAVERGGKVYKAIAKVIDPEKDLAFWEAVNEATEPRAIWEQAKGFAKENPRYTLALAAGTVALGALGAYTSYKQIRTAKDAEIGESVRAVRKSYEKAAPEEKERLSTLLSGGQWVEKVNAERSTTPTEVASHTGR